MATRGFQRSGRQILCQGNRHRSATVENAGLLPFRSVGRPVAHRTEHELNSSSFTVLRNARPNPSLKRSTNGRPPGPGLWHTVHFHSPGPGVLPSAPA
ncbi:hypothetical protein RA210_U280005 [Rubrivivax sp. A210]|nr:hypothetical protein RA210_U280005 [Rubrivivax sp. A210]